MSGFAPDPSKLGRPFHMGRAFHGHEIENDCPCRQSDCGLIHQDDIDPECPQHSFKAAKTIRQMHRDDECLITGITAILDEYLGALARTDGSDGPYVSWRDPEFDARQYALTQTTALLAMAQFLRARYPVIRSAVPHG